MALPSLTLLGQSLLSGLFIGALYGLLGLGLSLSWGMLRQINLAHFALAFLGAYLAYQLAAAGMDPLATLAVIVPFFFALGLLMHWLLARFSVSAFNSLLVTFGLSLLLSGLCAAFAGVAGLCLALSYTLAPGQIYAWLGVVFAAVMLGGLGNPLGPLVAGIVIGVSEALTMAFTAPAWAPLVSFSLLIAVLLARPGRI